MANTKRRAVAFVADTAWRRRFKDDLLTLVLETWGSRRRAIAEVLGLTTTLNAWCDQGKKELPSADSLMILCAESGWSPHRLLTGIGPQKQEATVESHDLLRELKIEIVGRLKSQGMSEEAASLVDPAKMLELMTDLARRYLDPWSILLEADRSMVEAMYDVPTYELSQRLKKASLGLFDVFDSLPNPRDSGVWNVVSRIPRRRPRQMRKKKNTASPATAKRPRK